MISRLHDPATYVDGVPFDDIESLRAQGPVAWLDEPELPGLPAGPGYHLVLDHALVTQVLKDPATFSSATGGTQIRDPANASDLRYVQRMMLNMDPPEHSRLRRMISRSFTPRAVRELEARIGAHAEDIVDRMLAGPPECDFAKDVAADLPLLTLADVLGVPPEDRWLMFDWSNRVIGFLDPDYAVSSSFDASRGSGLARAATAIRPAPDADGRMPDPAAAAACPTSTATPICSPRPNATTPGRTSCRSCCSRTRARSPPRSSRTCSGSSRWPATRRCATACPAA